MSLDTSAKKCEKVLEFVHVSYLYPDGTKALDDVSFSIATGERVALLGPNGAGKSTLMLLSNGILTPAEGTVCVCDTSLAKKTLEAARMKVGLVFQDPDDQLFMSTVHDDIGFGPHNMGLDAEEVHHRIHNALQAVDLDYESVRLKPGEHISFGQKKRIALATVLAMEPAILVLDEPTSNLDPRSRHCITEVLLARTEALLIATHDMNFAWKMCDRVLIVDEGRIVATGPKEEILRDRELLEAHGLELPTAL